MGYFELELLPNEEFRWVKGFENLYEVSNYGRVYSHYKGGKFLKGRPQREGYLQVALYKDGKGKNYSVHRLVGEAFIPNPFDLPEINHLNEVKTDNRVENLQWCLSIENVNYGTRNERMAMKRGRKVRCIETGEVYYSSRKAERELGLYSGAVARCCNGEFKQAKGLHFEWLPEGEEEGGNEK